MQSALVLLHLQLLISRGLQSQVFYPKPGFRTGEVQTRVLGWGFGFGTCLVRYELCKTASPVENIRFLVEATQASQPKLCEGSNPDAFMG